MSWGTNRPLDPRAAEEGVEGRGRLKKRVRMLAGVMDEIENSEEEYLRMH